MVRRPSTDARANLAQMFTGFLRHQMCRARKGPKRCKYLNLSALMLDLFRLSWRVVILQFDSGNGLLWRRP